jgi:hypothetical protein
MLWIPPLEESPGGLFIGVVRGSDNNVWTPLLTTRSHRVYNHEGIIVISHSQLLYTGPIMWWHVSPPVSLPPVTLCRALARQGLCFRPRVTRSTVAFVSMNTWGLHCNPALIVLSGVIICKGSFVSQCIQRLITPDDAKGPSAHSFQPASSWIQWNSTRMVMLGGLQHDASSPHPQQQTINSGHVANANTDQC